MHTASASAGARPPIQRSGRVVAARMPSTVEETATASAPCSSARRAASASLTQTMIEMPSPSEMRWLRRRALATDSEKRNWAGGLPFEAAPVVARRREQLDQSRALRAGHDAVRRVARDHPHRARLQLLRLGADGERHRAADQEPRLLVGMLMLGDGHVRLDLDVDEARLVADRGPADQPVPDLQHLEVVHVAE